MLDFERVSDFMLDAYANGETDGTSCYDTKVMARELIAQRAAAKYRRHIGRCIKKIACVDSLVPDDCIQCTCGYDALPGFLKGGG